MYVDYVTSEPAVPQLKPVANETPISASKIPNKDAFIEAEIDASMLIDSDQELVFPVPIT